MREKILFLSPFFHPEAISTGRYNTYLARALVHAGFSLDVITSHPLYPDWKPQASSATMVGAAISRGGLWIRYPVSTVLRRIVLELWFACYVVRLLVVSRERYEVAVVIFPPVCFALLPRRLFGAKKIVGIVHDLLGVMAKTRSGLVRLFIAKTMTFVERKAFQRCDRLICLSQAMKEIMVRDYGISAEKVIVRSCYLIRPLFTWCILVRWEKSSDRRTYWTCLRPSAQKTLGLYAISSRGGLCSTRCSRALERPQSSGGCCFMTSCRMNP